MSLARNAIFGAGANSAGAIVGFLIRFALNAALARMIAPETFGAFALAVVYTELAGILISASFSQAIVQLQESKELTLLATLQLNTVLALILLAAGAALAPVLTTVDGRDVAALTFALIAIRAVSLVVGAYDCIMQRDLRFGRLALVRVVGLVLTVVVSFALAWFGRPLVALVAREAMPLLFTAGVFVSTVPIDWGGLARPGAGLRAVRQNVFKLGVALFWFRALDILYQRADQFVLARVLGRADLAFYAQARWAASLPHTAVAPATQTVALPVLVAVSGESAKLQRTSELLQVAVGHALLACAAVIAFAPHILVRIAFGPRWDPVADTLPYFAPWVLLFPLVQNSQMALIALQRWRGLRTAQVMQLVVLALATPPLVYWWQARGAALALGVATMAGLLWMRGGFSPQERPRMRVFRSVAASALVLLAAWALKTVVTPRPSALAELGLTLGALALHGASALTVDRDGLSEMVRFVWSRLRSDASTPGTRSA